MDEIIFGASQSVHNFVYNADTFSTTEMQYMRQTNTWDWNDDESPSFSSAQILCNYTQNLNSSYQGTTGESITGFKLYRTEKGQSYETAIADLKIEELGSYATSSQNYYFSDPTARSNVHYEYSLYPYSANGFGTPIKGEATTEWTGYSLIELERADEKTYYIPSIKNFKTNNIPYNEWNFFIDTEEDSITQNQEQTIFTTFAKVPKISVGSLNYLSGKLKCLLGNISLNGQYREDTQTLNLWENFVSRHPICLFRNPKGDCRIIVLQDSPSRKYFNQYSNRYDNNNYITNRPTQIEFSWIEVAKMEDVKLLVSLPQLTTE